jgi:hypothetical protein
MTDDHCARERIDRGGGDYPDTWYCTKDHEPDGQGVCVICGFEHECPEGCPDRWTYEDAMSTRSEV